MPSEIETAIAEGLIDLGKLHDIIHGAEDAPDVPTEGGNVPPVAKRIANLEAAYEGSGVVAAAVAARDAAIDAKTDAEAALATIETAPVGGPLFAAENLPEARRFLEVEKVYGPFVDRAAAIAAGVPYDSLYKTRGGDTKWLNLEINALALAGDSITQQNGTAAYSQAVGFATNAAMLSNGALKFLNKVTTAHSGGLNFNFGYGAYSAADFLNGNRAGDGVYPMTDVAAADPSDVFVFLGSNASITSLADILTIWDTFRAAGRRVFAAEVLPRHSTAAGYTSTKLAETYALNDALKPAAAERKIPFLEWASLVAESPGGFGSLTYMPDAVHPNILGAEVLGEAFYNFLAPWLPDPFEPPVDGSAAWVTDNPYMTGDVSGVATGWNLTAANITAKSKVVDPDGTVWQRVTMSAGNNIICRQSAGAGPWAVGDTIVPVMRIRAVEAGWAFHNVENRITKTGSPSNTAAGGGMYSGAPTTVQVRQPMNGLIVGHPYVIPADATGIYNYIYAHGNGGTFDFRQAGCFKI